jgi:hypothetical protein
MEKTPSHEPTKRTRFDRDQSSPQVTHQRKISNAGFPVLRPAQNEPFSTFSLPPPMPTYYPTTNSARGQQDFDIIPELGDRGVVPGIPTYWFDTSQRLPKQGQETPMRPNNTFNSNSFNTPYMGTNMDFDTQLAISTQAEGISTSPLASEISTKGFVPQDSMLNAEGSSHSYYSQPSATSEAPHLLDPVTHGFPFFVSNDTQSDPFKRSGTRSGFFGDDYRVA